MALFSIAASYTVDSHVCALLTLLRDSQTLDNNNERLAGRNTSAIFICVTIEC